MPGEASIVSRGGGAPDHSGLLFNIGRLGAGATRTFQIRAHGSNAGKMTLTANATADRSMSVGRPALVTTAVIATPPAPTPPPTVLSAVRYGFYNQPTILVVTFNRDVNADEASNPRHYSVLTPAMGSDESDGVAGHDFVATMDLHALVGSAFRAPGASRIGVNSIPAGPLGAHSRASVSSSARGR